MNTSTNASPTPHSASIAGTAGRPHARWRLRHLFVVTTAVAIDLAVFRESISLGVFLAGVFIIGLALLLPIRGSAPRTAGDYVAAAMMLVVCMVVFKLLAPLDDPASQEAGRFDRQSRALYDCFLGLHSYCRTHRTLPEPTTWRGGQAWRSWRADVLPLLVDDVRRTPYEFDECWNSPTNQRLAAQRLTIYAADAEGRTPVLAVVDEEGRWPAEFTSRLQDESLKPSQYIGARSDVIVLIALPEPMAVWCELRDLGPGALTEKLLRSRGRQVERLLVLYADGRYEPLEVAELRRRLPQIFSATP